MTDLARDTRIEELHALVDGELDPARIPDVLRWLQDHPDDAVRVAQWQSQRHQLRHLHRSMDVGPTPDALTRTVLGAKRRVNWWHAAAAVVLLAVGATVGNLVSRFASSAPTTLVSTEPRFVRDAVIAHATFIPEKRHPVEVAADEEAHLVQWLSRRLGTAVKAPSLQSHGFRLMGGRLLPGAEAPRAQFMYEDERGRRVTLYVTVFGDASPPRPTAFRSIRDGAFESFYWVDGKLGYALSAELPPSDVLALAKTVYESLPR